MFELRRRSFVSAGAICSKHREPVVDSSFLCLLGCLLCFRTGKEQKDLRTIKSKKKIIVV